MVPLGRELRKGRRFPQRLNAVEAYLWKGDVDGAIAQFNDWQHERVRTFIAYLIGSGLSTMLIIKLKVFQLVQEQLNQRQESTMKVIIEITKCGSAIRAARQQIEESNIGNSVDFRLFLESAHSLFKELTPTRLDLLDTLGKIGLCNLQELATSTQKSYSSVENDVNRLEELGLIERTEEGKIFVPFEAIEILMPLAA